MRHDEDPGTVARGVEADTGNAMLVAFLDQLMEGTDDGVGAPGLGSDAAASPEPAAASAVHVRRPAPRRGWPRAEIGPNLPAWMLDERSPFAPEVKLMALRSIRAGASHADVVAAVGCSSMTVATWMNRALASGMFEKVPVQSDVAGWTQYVAGGIEPMTQGDGGSPPRIRTHGEVLDAFERWREDCVVRIVQGGEVLLTCMVAQGSSLPDPDAVVGPILAVIRDLRPPMPVIVWVGRDLVGTPIDAAVLGAVRRLSADAGGRVVRVETPGVCIVFGDPGQARIGRTEGSGASRLW